MTATTVATTTATRDRTDYSLGVDDAERARLLAQCAMHRTEAELLLDRVGLSLRANELAGSLAYGEQRRLEIARALGTNPGVILLDEPAAGTNPAEKRDLAALIKQVNDDGIGVLLIEHDMKLVMSVADRIVVLNFGSKIAEGSPEHIQRDPAVVAAYLGTSAEEAADELASHHQPELQRIETEGVVPGHDDASDDAPGRHEA